MVYFLVNEEGLFQMFSWCLVMIKISDDLM